jgi:hypothetical protein
MAGGEVVDELARVTKNGPAPTGQFAYRCADAGKVAARTIETRNQPWATPPALNTTGIREACSCHDDAGGWGAAGRTFLVTSVGTRSYWPSAKRYSMVIFLSSKPN